MNLSLQLNDLSDKDFERIRGVVYDHCGINLTKEKKELVRSRLSSQLRHHNMASYSDYLEMVLRDPNSAEFVQFINRLSTNLTSFFREPRHYDYLKKHVLPRIEAATPANGTLRIRTWSAACSSGEEPYTLAMVLKESLPSNRKTDVKILASDISTTVLDKARAGRYPAERLATVSNDLQRKYFEAQADKSGFVYTVRPELRQMVLFKQINLIQDWPTITPLDFIFCRNVLIYFDKATHKKLAHRFYDLLKPGGVLFIGHSESLSGFDHPFKNAGPATYTKP